MYEKHRKSNIYIFLILNNKNNNLNFYTLIFLARFAKKGQFAKRYLVFKYKFSKSIWI